MRAKQVYEFHKTADPLGSLNIGIKSLIKPYSVSKIHYHYLIGKSVNELFGNSNDIYFLSFKNSKICVPNNLEILDKIKISGDIPLDLKMTSILQKLMTKENLLKAVELSYNTNAKVHETVLGTIAYIYDFFTGFYVCDERAAINLRIWEYIKPLD